MKQNTKPRLAEADDLARITRIIHEVGLFSDEEAAGFVEMTEAHFAAPDPGHRWWITDGGDGAAYLAPEMPAGVWNLLFLGVRPAARGQGIATSLIGAIEASLRADGGRLLIIDTSSLEPMRAARSLYRHLGYAHVGTVRNYWADGDDKVIFQKRL